MLQPAFILSQTTKSSHAESNRTQYSKNWPHFFFILCCFQIPRAEESGSRYLTARSTEGCGCSSGGTGCQHHTAQSSPFQLLAQSMAFSVTLSFIFPAPVTFSSWTSWVMIWHPSALSHNSYQRCVCPGSRPCVSAAPHLRSRPHSVMHFPSSPSFTKEFSIFFSSHLLYLRVYKLHFRGVGLAPVDPSIQPLLAHRHPALQMSPGNKTHSPSTPWAHSLQTMKTQVTAQQLSIKHRSRASSESCLVLPAVHSMRNLSPYISHSKN